jgi:hypothetical protein
VIPCVILLLWAIKRYHDELDVAHRPAQDNAYVRQRFFLDWQKCGNAAQPGRGACVASVEFHNALTAGEQ